MFILFPTQVPTESTSPTTVGLKRAINPLRFIVIRKLIVLPMMLFIPMYRQQELIVDMVQHRESLLLNPQ